MKKKCATFDELVKFLEDKGFNYSLPSSYVLKGLALDLITQAQAILFLGIRPVRRKRIRF